MRFQNRKAILFSVLLTVCFLLSAGSVLAESTDDKEVRVFVTISDQDGKLVLAREEIVVRDADGDGVWTVNDALLCAHEAKFEGGLSGYAFEATAYGLSMTKLWGVENGGAYGYYVNHMAAMSLADPIAHGDLICAFIYTDVEAWSDTYCYFDVDHTVVVGDDPLALTLAASGYDENWNPITVPVAGATILINGVETAFVTDEEGKVVLQFDGAGYCVVSARKDGVTLVPPVCGVAVRSENPAAGDSSQVVLWTVVACMSFGVLMVLRRRARVVDQI